MQNMPGDLTAGPNFVWEERAQSGAVQTVELTRLWLACMMNMPQAGWAIAAPRFGESRKVRTPQGTAPGKSRDGEICRTGPQKTTAGVSKSSTGIRQRILCKVEGLRSW